MPKNSGLKGLKVNLRCQVNPKSKVQNLKLFEGIHESGIK
jgi:hypothetical protein